MKTRFIKSVIQAARDCDTDMPWSRTAKKAKPASRKKAARPA